MTAPHDSAPRRAADGDIPDDLSPAGIERHVVTDATDGAQDARVEVIQDVLARSDRTEMLEVARWLDDVLAGTSPDDLVTLRHTLVDQDEPIYGEIPLDDDDELVEHWRSGVYPYRTSCRASPTSARSTACRSSC